MPGVTKRIFEHEIRDILSMWNNEIESIQPLLPREYSEVDIIALLKEFYPHEWHSVKIKYDYYQNKDRYISKRFGKSRYNMKSPEALLMSTSQCKKILSKGYRQRYYDNYIEESSILARTTLWKKESPK